MFAQGHGHSNHGHNGLEMCELMQLKLVEVLVEVFVTFSETFSNVPLKR